MAPFTRSALTGSLTLHSPQSPKRTKYLRTTFFCVWWSPSMTTILSSSSSLCSLKLFRLSSRESLIDGAFLGNRTKPSQSLHLRFRMEAVSSISTSLSCISVGEDFPAEYEQWLPVPDRETRRRAGVLLHPTSFRGPHGIGDLGEEAFHFIDWLHSTGCSVWQVREN